MFWFVFASLFPAVVLALAGVFGGVWAWASVFVMTVWVAGLDRWTTHRIQALDADQAERGATRLMVALAVAHLALLPIGVRAIAASPDLTTAQAVALFTGLALFMGQISHPNAHELIHRPGRGLRLLGRVIYTSMLFGHHASAHLKVHHVHVATPKDPNSAPQGLGFYRFFVRAWAGSFGAGLRAENRDRARRRRPAPQWQHPYVTYIGGGLALLILSWGLAGMGGVAVLLGLSLYAQIQILLADYVQHYGLRRRLFEGRAEPVGNRHAWNAQRWYSAAMMLNAPRHSDHHLHPGRAFPALDLDAQAMPMLPLSMPVMCVLALVPPIWRRVMDRRVAVWGPHT